MATFDQRGQHVNYQYNAAGDINFGAVQNQADFIDQLRKLKQEASTAAKAQVIDSEQATDVDYQLTKALQQAEKPEKDKNKILEHLQQAKAAIEGVAAAGGLVTALIKAAELARNFF